MSAKVDVLQPDTEKHWIRPKQAKGALSLSSSFPELACTLYQLKAKLQVNSDLSLFLTPQGFRVVCPAIHVSLVRSEGFKVKAYPPIHLKLAYEQVA